MVKRYGDHVLGFDPLENTVAQNADRGERDVLEKFRY